MVIRMNILLKSVSACLGICSLIACAPESSEDASNSGVVQIGESTSVRVNGQPIARAIDGNMAGAVLLDAECDGIRKSQNVRINGSAATILNVGSTDGCELSESRQVSANVRVGN